VDDLKRRPPFSFTEAGRFITTYAILFLLVAFVAGALGALGAQVLARGTIANESDWLVNRVVVVSVALWCLTAIVYVKEEPRVRSAALWGALSWIPGALFVGGPAAVMICATHPVTSIGLGLVAGLFVYLLCRVSKQLSVGPSKAA
jgi:hypothetical protein